MGKYISKAQRTWTSGGGGSGPTPPSGCCYELISVASLQALAGTNGLVQGTFYQITNVTPDWQIVVLAESTSKVSTQGQGIYQDTLYTEAWYELDTNTITRIYDPLYDNDISGLTISTFAWNNPKFYNNLVDSNSLILGLDSVTINTTFNGNRVVQGSNLYIFNSFFDTFSYNTVEEGSSFYATFSFVFSVTNNKVCSGSLVRFESASIDTYISGNTWSNKTNFQSYTHTGSTFFVNTFSDGSYFYLDGTYIPYVAGNNILQGNVDIENVFIGGLASNQIFNSTLTSYNSQIQSGILNNSILDSSLSLNSCSLNEISYNNFTSYAQLNTNSLYNNLQNIQYNTITNDSLVSLSGTSGISANFNNNTIHLVGIIYV